MADVILFKPREQISAEQQVSDFIGQAKRITAFDLPGYPLDWNAVNWSAWLKGATFVKQGVGAHRVRPNAKVPLSADEILDDEIIDFAKAYTLFSQAMQRTSSMREIPAIRALEIALLDLRGRASITLSDEAVFDRAAEAIRGHFAQGRAYHIGAALADLAAFLSEKKLVPQPLTWTNPIRRQTDLSRGHRKRKEDAKKKLPSQSALDAIAEIFASRPTSLRDIVTSSSAAMLMCAPARVGELVEAVKNPFVEKETRGGKKELFVSWHGEKGFGRHDKPVPETMAPLYKEAVKRVVEVTEDARALALWLENNQNEFPPHPGRPEVGQDVLLTPEQVLDALSLAHGRTAKTTLKSSLKGDLSAIQKNGGKSRYPKTYRILNEALESVESIDRGDRSTACSLTLRKLNTVLREWMLPASFPYVSEKRITKFSDALFCFFENALAESSNKPLRPFSLMQLSNNTVNNDLSPVPASRPNGTNIFMRWNYVGDEYAMTTHQFRHWLNTIAQKGHVGQIEIARWSGRADISQNAVYNHRTPEDEVADMRKVGLGTPSGNLAERSRKNDPILVSELGENTREDRIAHVTLYGFCEHDFAQEPCQKHRSCITCKKHKCVKGDDVKLERLKFERDSLKTQLDKAAARVDQGWNGADRWLEDCMRKFEAANELIDLMEDPEIEEGAVIKAVDDGFTALSQAIEMRGETKDSGKPKLAAPEHRKDYDMRRLLGMLGR